MAKNEAKKRPQRAAAGGKGKQTAAVKAKND